MGLQKIQPGETEKIIAEPGKYDLTVKSNKVRFAGSNSSASDGRLVKTPSDVDDVVVERSDNGLFGFNPGPSVAEVEVADK